MAKIFDVISYPKTRLYLLCNLVFFVVISGACGDPPGRDKISIVTEGGRSAAIFIPSGLIPEANEDKLDEDVHIRMSGSRENMLGDYRKVGSGIQFRPLIELNPGRSYQVWFKGRKLQTLTVPANHQGSKASLNGIYPSADTLPENLLKIYLSFSKPMRQGVSEKYLTLLDGKNDTLQDVFLNLNTELWDEEGRQLTIWLDPGRIKRGLQPNEKAGNPLRTGNSYTLAVSPGWTDLKGGKLDKAYTKRFIATSRDIQSPDLSLWKISVPKAATVEPISVNFNEALDYSLLHNTITVIRRDGEPVKGNVAITNNERSLLFHPKAPWSAGIYYLKIDSRLEDLAGNNLNRLFDRDLLKDKPAGKEEFFTKQFRVD